MKLSHDQLSKLKTILRQNPDGNTSFRLETTFDHFENQYGVVFFRGDYIFNFAISRIHGIMQA